MRRVAWLHLRTRELDRLPLGRCLALTAKMPGNQDWIQLVEGSLRYMAASHGCTVRTTRIRI